MLAPLYESFEHSYATVDATSQANVCINSVTGLHIGVYCGAICFSPQERTKNAQFIIISLRSNMFELADRLVGIYKIYNCTRSVTINPKLYGVPGSQGQPASQAGQVS